MFNGFVMPSDNQSADYSGINFVIKSRVVLSNMSQHRFPRFKIFTTFGTYFGLIVLAVPVAPVSVEVTLLHLFPALSTLNQFVPILVMDCSVVLLSHLITVVNFFVDSFCSTFLETRFNVKLRALQHL